MCLQEELLEKIKKHYDYDKISLPYYIYLDEYIDCSDIVYDSILTAIEEYSKNLSLLDAIDIQYDTFSYESIKKLYEYVLEKTGLELPYESITGHESESRVTCVISGETLESFPISVECIKEELLLLIDEDLLSVDDWNFLYLICVNLDFHYDGTRKSKILRILFTNLVNKHSN